MKITNTNRPMALDIKRFYAPFKLKHSCPKCGHDCGDYFEDNYISYPIINQAENIDFYCDECGHEWSGQIKIRVTAKVVDGE